MILLQEIIQLGLIESDDDDTRRSIIICNSMVMAAIFVLLLHTFFLIDIDLSVALFILFEITVASSILIASYCRYLLLTRLCCIIALASGGFVAAALFGKDFNGLYYIFIALCLCNLVLDYRHRTAQVLCIIFSTLLIVLVEYLHYANLIPLYSDEIREQVKQQWGSQLMDILLIVIALVGSIGYEQNRLRNARMELRQHNESLEQRIDERTQEIKQALEEARSANSAKSEFLAAVTHELRTPLHVINNSRELIQRGLVRFGDIPLNENKTYFMENCRRIETSSDRLLAMVDQVLFTTRAEIRDSALVLETVRIDLLIQQVCDDFYSRATARTVTIENSENTNISIQTSPQLLTLVIGNLLQNALKYCLPNSTLAVSSKQLPHHVSIDVVNSGIGINESEVSLVFEQFYKGKNVGSAKGGVGLGLALSNKIVKRLGGEIKLVNHRPECTHFRVLLPINQRESSSS